MKKIIFILSVILCTSIKLCAQIIESENLLFVYSLHGQTRKYNTTFYLYNDTLSVRLSIERNTKWQSSEFITLPEALNSGTSLSFLQPIDKNIVTLPKNETFNILSRKAYKELKNRGAFVYSNVAYRIAPTKEILNSKQPLLHVIEDYEGCEMWILDNPSLPIIWKMKNNPLEIDWEVKSDVESIFDIKEQITLMPEKSGSTYFAYPAYSWQQTPVPEGYTPFYISHYGRHGSRWISEENRYTDVVNAFENVELTELGKDVKRRLDIIYQNAKGNAGLLSPIGEQQHREIARRMFARFPEVLNGNRNISAYSTTFPRCIKSMQCFTDELIRLNKSLKTKKDSDKKNMSYMAFDTPEMTEWNRKDAEWREAFTKFEKRNMNSERLISSLFVNPIEKKKADELMMGLYWIASDMQDTMPDMSLYDLFTTNELFGIWKSINYRMYLCNGGAPINKGIPAMSASSLLKDVIDKADRAIKNGKESATLRFGHDTNLLRLITLLGIEEYSAKESDEEKYHLAWQDFNITPMAGNLQIIFYKNNKSDVVVKFMVNEKEVHLPVETNNSPYYNWNDVRSYLSKKIQ